MFAGAAPGVAPGALSAGLLACARESGAPSPSVGQRDATLQFMYAGEPTVLDTHTAMSELFTRQYPRIKVEQQHTPAQYVDKVYNLAAAGTLPDVFWGGGADMIDFADRKIPRALKPLIQRDKLDTADLFPPSLSQYQWKGEQYGLPRDWAARILFYNVDAFKQAGVPRPPASWKDTSRTWDAGLDVARMGGGASCLRRVMAHPDVSRQRPPEHFNIFAEAGDHVQIDPQVLRWSQMNAAIDKEMTDLWDGKRGAKDIAAAMCQGIEPYLAEQRH